jgi:hypothetical protein
MNETQITDTRTEANELEAQHCAIAVVVLPFGSGTCNEDLTEGLK